MASVSSPPHALQVDLTRMGLRDKLGLYLRTVSTSGRRFFFEQVVFLFASWVPTPLGAALRAVLYPLVVRMGWPVLIEKNVTIHRPGALRLGRNVYLAENVYLLAGGDGIVIGDHTELLPNVALVIRDYRGAPHPSIEIGRRCSLNVGSVVFSHGRTVIGDDVQVGPGAVITTGNHLYGDPSLPVRLQGGEISDVEIEAGAWIGAQAVILPGVRVGTGAVVGAGAVVTEDVPPYSLVVGVPARVVRTWAPTVERAARS